MRHILLSSLLCTAVAFPAAALAQAKATRTADDYVCAFTDSCADQAPAEAEETREAPPTKGFSLSRKVAAKPDAAPARSQTQAASTPAAGPAVKRLPGTPRPSGPRTASVSTERKADKPRAAAAQRRADLRLTFELASATLTAQAMEEAKVFAESLKRPELAGKRFLIEGHTDSQGGRDYNLDLSQRRAQAVADYLTTLGVEAERLEVRGYGFERPLDGRSAAAQENRRVEALLKS